MSRTRFGKLRLEALEERCTPAAYTVTLATDNNVNGGGQADPMNAAQGDLRYCITQADQGGGADTVTIKTGINPTVKDMLPSITKGMTIMGQGMANTTISANTAEPVNYRIFQILGQADNVTIQKLTITGGNMDGDGGGIYNSGQLNLWQVDIDHCEGTNGGGIACEGNKGVLLDAVSIHDNTATSNGGGVYVSNGGVAAGLVITNSSIQYNQAVNGGGVYNAATNTTTVSETGIYQNTASGGGGGVYNAGSGSLVINESSVVQGNEAYNGGGLWSDGTATLTNVSLSCNTAEGAGGGFYLENGTLTTNNGAISSNAAAAGTAGYFYVDGVNPIWNDNGTTHDGTFAEGN
jgi:hypothetical protein